MDQHLLKAANWNDGSVRLKSIWIQWSNENIVRFESSIFLGKSQIDYLVRI
jgi:hypothetical protein